MNYKSSTWWAVNLQVSKVEFQLGDSQKGFTAICGAFEILLSNLSHFELRILQDPGWFPRTSDFLGALVVDSSTRYTMGSKTWLLWSFCTKVLHAMIYSYFQCKKIEAAVLLVFASCQVVPPVKRTWAKSQIRKLHRIPGPSIFSGAKIRRISGIKYIYCGTSGGQATEVTSIPEWHPHIFSRFGKFSHLRSTTAVGFQPGKFSPKLFGSTFGGWWIDSTRFFSGSRRYGAHSHAARVPADPVLHSRKSTQVVS